jgi:hypothetical protein
MTIRAEADKKAAERREMKVPWSIVSRGTNIQVVDENDDVIANLFCDDGDPKSYQEQYSHARLIAAAPDLLEACKQASKEIYHLMSELGDDPNKVGYYNRLNQAIFAAEKS